jgi:transposase InsO family protein
MVTSPEYRHVPTGTLAVLAQRLHRVSASPSTWYRLDTTVIRLLDGTRAYLHAVIDNFSRRILAWRVAETFAPVNGVAVLLEASRGRPVQRLPQSCWRTRAWKTSTPRSTP